MMRKRNALSIGCILCFWSVLLWPLSGSAIESIPKESGFSGYINVGGAYISAENNMVKGTDLFEIGNNPITSLSSSPDSESDYTFILGGELAYTFAQTRTQLYAGNQLEDLLRFDFATLLGVRQELPDGSIGAVSAVLQPLATEVWKDPYVTDVKRQDTDLESTGLRLEWDRPFGSNLGLLYQYRSIDIDDEQSGTLGGLGLAPNEIRLLDREGDIHRVDLSYLWKLGGGHALMPEIQYIKWDLDGDAMASDGIFLNLTHAFTCEKFTLMTTGSFGTEEFDKRNPVFNKTREEDTYGLGINAFWHQPFNFPPGFSLVGTLAWYDSDSNINFYDSQVTYAGLSFMYKF